MYAKSLKKLVTIKNWSSNLNVRQVDSSEMNTHTNTRTYSRGADRAGTRGTGPPRYLEKLIGPPNIFELRNS